MPKMYCKKDIRLVRKTLTLQGLRPAAMAPLGAIVLYYLNGILVNSEKSHASPPPMGAGLAQGGRMIVRVRFGARLVLYPLK